MNKTFANLLDKYLTHNVKQNNLSGYYINVMNNNEKEGNKIDTNHNKIFVRSEHNHTNITVMKYFDMGNNFKSFDEREWYYVICNENNELNVEIRTDLIDSWKETNAKDSVIILNAHGMVWELPMSYFFNGGETKWNAECNTTNYFVLPNPTFETSTETVDNPGTVKYLLDSWKFLGHTSYAKYKSYANSKQMVVAAYDSNGNFKGQHIMKSLGQVYGVLDLDNYGTLRNFQRKVKANDNEMFITDKNGKTYWISFRTWATAPETVEMSVKPTELKETVVEIKGEKAQEIYETIIETANVTPSNATKRVERLQEYSKKTRIIRHEPMVAKSFGKVPNAFAALCDTKPKRIIVRG